MIKNIIDLIAKITGLSALESIIFVFLIIIIYLLLVIKKSKRRS